MSTERQENERPAKLTPQARQQNLGALLQEFGQTREAIENELAKMIIGARIKSGDMVSLAAEDGHIRISKGVTV